MFKILDLGRADVAIETRVDGLEMLRKLNLKDIHMLEPLLVTIKLYHYLHKSNAALVRKITKVLQEMEAEGRIKAIRDIMSPSGPAARKTRRVIVRTAAQTALPLTLPDQNIDT